MSSWTTGPNSIYFHKNVARDALYLNRSDGLAQLNEMGTSAKNKNIIKFL